MYWKFHEGEIGDLHLFSDVVENLDVCRVIPLQTASIEFHAGLSWSVCLGKLGTVPVFHPIPKDSQGLSSLSCFVQQMGLLSGTSTYL